MWGSKTVAGKGKSKKLEWGRGQVVLDTHWTCHIQNGHQLIQIIINVFRKIKKRKRIMWEIYLQDWGQLFSGMFAVGITQGDLSELFVPTLLAVCRCVHNVFVIRQFDCQLFWLNIEQGRVGIVPNIHSIMREMRDTTEGCSQYSAGVKLNFTTACSIMSRIRGFQWYIYE